MSSPLPVVKLGVTSYQPPEVIGDSVRVTRRFAGLLGGLSKAEVDAIFTQLPFTPADASKSATDLRRSARTELAKQPPVDAGPLPTKPIPVEAQPVGEEVQKRHSFKRWYEAVADYDFGLVPIASLLTPQWQVDLDYVDELAAQAPHPEDWSAALAFAMPEGTIGEPVVSQNQVIFSSHRADLFCAQIPEVRSTGPGVYEIVVTAHSRPNYLQVVRLKNRLILTNGVHKTLAMSKRGYSEIPCVIRTAGAYEELGLTHMWSFLRPEVVEGARPILVQDFLNDGLAAPLLMRGTDQVLRVSVIIEQLSIPALQA